MSPSRELYAPGRYFFVGSMTHGLWTGRSKGMTQAGIQKRTNSRRISSHRQPPFSAKSNRPKQSVTKALLRRSYQLELVSLTSQQINAVLEIPVILRTLVSAGMKVAGATGGMGGYLIDDKLTFCEYNRKGELLPILYIFECGQGIPGLGMQTRQPYITNDAANDSTITPGLREQMAVANLVHIPLCGRAGNLLGSFELHNKPRPFSEDDIHLLQGLAANAAVALENAQILRERLDAENNLCEREAQLAGIIDTAMDAIITFDSGQRISQFNHAAEEMFHCKAEQVIGQPIDRLLPERVHATHRRLVREYAESGRTSRFHGNLGVLSGVRADGSEFPAEISISMTETHGQRFFTAILRDVTERQRAERQLRSREQHLILLNAITRSALETTTLRQMLEEMAARFAEFMHADGCYVALWDDTGECPVPVTGYGTVSTAFEEFRYQPGEPSLAAAVLDRGKAVAVEQVDACEHISARAVEQLPAQSLLGLPLIADNRRLGVAYIAFDRRHSFTQEEIAQGEQAADQIALALAKARHLDETRQRLADLEAINRLSTSLRIAQTMDEMLPRLLEETLATLNTPAGMIAFNRSAEGLDNAVARGWWSVLQDHDGAVDQICSQVLSAAQPLLAREWKSNFLLNDEMRARIPGGWGGAIVPIRTAEQIVGILAVSVELPRELLPHEVRLLMTVAEIAGNAIHRTRLHESLEEAYLQTVLALARAMDARDTYTAGHSDRLADWATALAHAMQLSAEEKEDLSFAARLHDIGKIGVPDAILRKPGPLDMDEWQIMKRHPSIGAEIIQPVKRLQNAVAIVRHHQEKYDGSGYPDGLSGHAIPIGARILAVVDAYSAIVDERTYRRARSPREALKEIRRCAGTQFDPKVVEHFCQIARSKI